MTHSCPCGFTTTTLAGVKQHLTGPPCPAMTRIADAFARYLQRVEQAERAHFEEWERELEDQQKEGAS